MSLHHQSPPITGGKENWDGPNMISKDILAADEAELEQQRMLLSVMHLLSPG